MRKRKISPLDVEWYADRFVKRYPGCGKDAISVLRMYADGIDVETISRQTNYSTSAIYKTATKFREFCIRTSGEMEVIDPTFMDILTDDPVAYKFILYLFAVFTEKGVEQINIRELPLYFDMFDDKEHGDAFIDDLSRIRVRFRNTKNPFIEYFVQNDRQEIDCRSDTEIMADLFESIHCAYNHVYFDFTQQVKCCLILGRLIYEWDNGIQNPEKPFGSFLNCNLSPDQIIMFLILIELIKGK